MKGFHETGAYNVIWNGNNSHGKPMPSGIYFYRINALSDKSVNQSSHLTKKMIYLK
jgi:flagellar hook assembly protein FlgD